ncbi:hypothetical protein BpHYR1_034704 [Brachionus plicatilis]|uniref:Uncharacterized protein n=1 Tax=Brachionus plicatilis TaxID=10195 RepID=A0A3M7PXB4_BRAPC|nr:hypothetical protein BpHYR1_034704 [Brachionus plicatilis]
MLDNGWALVERAVDSDSDRLELGSLLIFAYDDGFGIGAGVGSSSGRLLTAVLGPERFALAAHELTVFG